MRYHFIVDLDSPDVQRQMQEQKGFAETYFKGIDEGEAILYSTKSGCASGCGQSHAKEAVAAVLEDDAAETILKALEPLICREDLYLFSGEEQNAALAVRLGARTGGSAANGVHEIRTGADQRLTVKRMMYANHMDAVCDPGEPPFFFTMAKGADRAELDEAPFCIQRETYTASAASHILSEVCRPREAGSGLKDSPVIVAGGRGIGGRAGMEELRSLAEALGGTVGASRPVVMNAWAPMEELLGVSGTLVQPQICITAGVSGAAAFGAGIEKSRWITAVNKDGNAPIMKMADVAVVEDYEPFVKALKALIREED